MLYLASPYSHKDPSIRHYRFEAVCIQVNLLIRAGIHVFSPVAHGHPVSRQRSLDGISVGALPNDVNYWEAVNNTWLDRSDHLGILTLPGWRESKGIAREYTGASLRNLPIVYYRFGITLPTVIAPGGEPEHFHTLEE